MASLVLCCRDQAGHAQKNDPTPSSPDWDTQLPKTAHLQQDPLPAITLFSVLHGRGRGTDSCRSFRKSWARCSYPRNNLTRIKPLPTVPLSPWIKHSCCWPHCSNFQSCLNNRTSSLLHWPYLLSEEGAGMASPSDPNPTITTCGTLCIDVIPQPHSTVTKLCSGWPLHISQPSERR